MMGNSLVVQCLGLCAFTAEGLGSIPGGETKIPQAVQCCQKKKKKKRKENCIYVYLTPGLELSTSTVPQMIETVVIQRSHQSEKWYWGPAQPLTVLEQIMSPLCDSTPHQ